MRDFVEPMDQKTDVTKLWRTIKGIDGRAKREAENEAITFNGISFSSSKQLATKFNQQFNAGQTYFFKRDQGSDEGNQEETIGDGANIHHGPSDSKAFGPDKLSIFHLKHLGPRVIEYMLLLSTYPSCV